MKRFLSIIAVLMLAGSTAAWAGGMGGGGMGGGGMGGGGMGGMGNLISELINSIMGSGVSNHSTRSTANQIERTNLIPRGFFDENHELRRDIEAKETAISHELEHRQLDRQKLIQLHMQLLTLQQELSQQLDQLERSQQQSNGGLRSTGS